MKTEVEKQIRGILKKQKILAVRTLDPVEKSMVYGAWSGFLAGLKMAKVIDDKEYSQFFNELVETTKEIRIIA